MTNAVATLIEQIRTSAAARGLTLHRYQTNKGSHAVVITYALHSAAERPKYSRDCDGARITLNAREGKTERCEAFRGLAALAALV